jgi:hypothetical protein
MGESHDVRVMKGVDTEDVMQARSSVQMPGGGPRILQVNEPNARFKVLKITVIWDVAM